MQGHPETPDSTEKRPGSSGAAQHLVLAGLGAESAHRMEPKEGLSRQGNNMR